MVRLRRKIVHMDSLLLTLGTIVSNSFDLTSADNHHAVVAACKLLQNVPCWIVQNASQSYSGLSSACLQRAQACGPFQQSTYSMKSGLTRSI